jgi:hypothetical protein
MAIPKTTVLSIPPDPHFSLKLKCSSELLAATEIKQ